MEVDEYSEKGLIEHVKRPSSAPPFLLKTYMLVEDPATDEVISWNAEGTGFVVWQTAEFARDLLPTLFKHSNFSSFVRQLNTYGFRKVATTRWEFSNNKFRRGGKDLLCEIRRKKAWSSSNKQTRPNNNNNNNNNDNNNNCNNSSNNNNNRQIVQLAKEWCDEDQRSSSTSSSPEYYSCLMDENKRLKKENGVLSCELSIMKNKCKKLLDLVTVYTINSADQNQYHHHLQLFGVERPKPKLFGVRLEVQDQEMEIRKRKRDEIISEISTVNFLSQSCK